MVFPFWSLIPFVALLLCIALLPIAIPRWWELNRNKLLVSTVASIPILLLVIPHEPNLLAHSLKDYVSFVILLGSLFVISGGVFISGSFAGTPFGNTLFLGLGAVLSNFIGTTGASMLLIRPYIRANHRRQKKSHLMVFFIFVVSNIGGLLTPLGDPPLFLGFLRGVPFHWTLSLIPHWVLAVGSLLLVFNFYDQYVFNREDVETPGALTEDVQPRRRIHIQGKRNFVYLLGVMIGIVASGAFAWPRGIQETIILSMALLSWFTTSRMIHESNHFHFHPIAEIAALFMGIFVTMIPALELLNHWSTALNIREPWMYFWLTGMVNAPTYLAFVAMASGIAGGTMDNLRGLVQSDLGESLLRAVSCGAVFMGANTYIGNGPNFMVKSIAERSGIRMPSFGGYMLYSGLILTPLYVVMTLVFFR